MTTLSGSLILDTCGLIILSYPKSLGISSLPVCLPPEAILGNCRNRNISNILLPSFPLALNMNQLPFLLVTSPQLLTDIDAQAIRLIHSQPEELCFQTHSIHCSSIKKLYFLFLDYAACCKMPIQKKVKHLFAKQTNNNNPNKKDFFPHFVSIPRPESYFNILPTLMLSNSMLFSHT